MYLFFVLNKIFTINSQTPQSMTTCQVSLALHAGELELVYIDPYNFSFTYFSQQWKQSSFRILITQRSMLPILWISGSHLPVLTMCLINIYHDCFYTIIFLSLIHFISVCIYLTFSTTLSTSKVSLDILDQCGQSSYWNRRLRNYISHKI